MKSSDFCTILDSQFYVGVPDSQLSGFCDYLMCKYGTDGNHHVIAANEGNCIAIAAGYHLSTGMTPVVYMQNSGEGNVVNPIVSLANDAVYGIPCMLVIGWRGEPGVPDEPQHDFQGRITLSLLENIGIEYFVLDKSTGIDEIQKKIDYFKKLHHVGKQTAIIVKKHALTNEVHCKYQNNFPVLREEAIKCISAYAKDGFIVSTTGKASRELFEIREKHKQTHSHDFLTVGSMGHSSSIALGIALQQQNKRIWCIDGDGAVLMHMGALAVIGKYAPKNLVHVVINNGAHESVGGIPTVARDLNLCDIAKACGYMNVFCAQSIEELNGALDKVTELNCLSFIEVKCGIGSREDLGRPTIKPRDNKEEFMNAIR